MLGLSLFCKVCEVSLLKMTIPNISASPVRRSRRLSLLESHDDIPENEQGTLAVLITPKEKGKMSACGKKYLQEGVKSTYHMRRVVLGE